MISVGILPARARNTAGRVVSNSPWRVVDYWDMTQHAELADFHTEAART